ncbi:hypothetical protein [Amycolatopsis tolypomycina]|uniref:hypothetical protein n=1 Tax=Amycolatopsis tolypomycina TaxID=208445 RepID=UPI0033AA7ACA
MTTTDAIHVESISVAIEPNALRWARYAIGNDGEFIERGVRWARDGEHAVVELAGLPDASATVTYTSTTARTAAARLLGYVHQLDHDEPLPEHVLTYLLAPDTRTATDTTWHLDDGLALRYLAPFGASLTAETAEWTLTAELAAHWARALLTLAAELDHAHAVATRAVIAERTGKTPTENIWAWLTDLHHELTADQKRLAERVRGVLADEERIARGETVTAALDVAHPDLPTSLADLRLLSRETITHEHAAQVIRLLADRYALPIYVWTAASRYIRDQIGGGTLTEQEWLQVGRTVEMGNFGPMIENEQDNNGGASLNIQLALYQAGVLCRKCDARITGEIATTLGRCDECRPADPDEAMAEVLAAGCLDSEWHTPSSIGLCADCGVPLPADYHLALAAAQAEQRKREAVRQAVAMKKHRVMVTARRLLAENRAQAGDDSAEAKERRLVMATEEVRRLRDQDLENGYASFVAEATRIIEHGDQDAKLGC